MALVQAINEPRQRLTLGRFLLCSVFAICGGATPCAVQFLDAGNGRDLLWNAMSRRLRLTENQGAARPSAHWYFTVAQRSPVADADNSP